MKKIISSLLFIFIFLNTGFAKDIDLAKNFKPNCYKLQASFNLKQTSKILSNKKIDVFIKDNKIIPYKLYKKAGEEINYKIKNLEGNLDYLKDNNYKTYLTYNEEKTKNPIEIEFNKILKAGSFKFNFEYKANYRNALLEISKDGKNFYRLDKYKLGNYDFKYLRISFVSSVKHITPPEQIKIFELNFIENNYQYIVNSKGNIKAFAENICKNYYPNLKNNYGNFNIDINTPSILINLEKNPFLDPNKIEDKDNDKIIDKEDNCPTIYNPKQIDTNGNGIGDKCEDIDGDNIIGFKDNCPTIYNPDQKDINRNNVGDKCEFDKDKDGIFDSIDNCINTPNPDQKDSDKDGIGDACDNCERHNPRQIDKDKNGIGDVCDEYEKFLKQNDDDKDGIINSKDNCPKIANLSQLDTDKDGIGDVCDNCRTYQNSNQMDENKNGIGDICEDSDGDGIEGLNDNCINTFNPDQKDSDNDGIGDACEDDDGDSIPAKNDNCPFDYNPKQLDKDNDGIGDACDKKDNRFIESNKTIFIALLVLVVLIFAFAIFKMIKKLK